MGSAVSWSTVKDRRLSLARFSAFWLFGLHRGCLRPAVRAVRRDGHDSVLIEKLDHLSLGVLVNDALPY